MAYKLKLPEGSRIHLVSHISLLKQKLGDSTFPTKELPTTTEEGNVILQLKEIQDTRWVTKGAKLVEESLVQWKGLPVEDATWESIKELL